jgi:membrane protein
MINTRQLPYTLSQLWPWLRYVVTRFGDDQCMRSAAALTYMSLFALVPLMTVSFTVVSAVPAFSGVGEQIQAALFDNLVPSAGAEVETYLAEFSNQTRNLTGIGIAFLVVTAVLMLRSIESAFNIIWRSRENRSTIHSFLLYWAVLSLGPVFIGLALGISTYLTSAALFFEDFDIIGIGAAMLKMAPLMLSTAAFTLIYAAVPNSQVPIKHALLGGLIAAIVFNTARSLFTKLMVGSSYTVIYGAFAAFPLFLLWIYVSWNIVLGGGIVVHSLSSFQNKEASKRPRLMKALSVLHLFWKRQQAGLSISEINLLKLASPDTRGLDSESWTYLRDIFLLHKLIKIDEKGQYLLARDLHEITLWQLKEWVNREVALEDLVIGEDGDWLHDSMELLKNQRQQQRELMHMSLAELFRE